MTSSRENVLFITLDSCRFDTFANGCAPNIRAVAPLHQAQAPSYFTYGSHSAMFAGFTPGIPGAAEPFLDPKFGKLFKLVGAGHPGKGSEGFELSGRNIVEGFRARGYSTIGTAAMGWFDPATPTAAHLIGSFEHFFYAGPYFLRQQVAWVEERLSAATAPTFTFINVGETHVPYWHEGAPWEADDNPCRPFQDVDRSAECRERQSACLAFADTQLGPLLERHRDGTIIVCGDHGDCWGEDGVWEHGIMHPMTTTVPLLIRHRGAPVTRRAHAPGQTRTSALSRLAQRFNFVRAQ
ncbi:MAG: hypothetical protein DI629_09910 [Mesorhizobium amorphae]|nr:MAG: hypothetical protein DI629_09910 [Mesorhizobium amorphae]